MLACVHGSGSVGWIGTGASARSGVSGVAASSWGTSTSARSGGTGAAASSWGTSASASSGVTRASYTDRWNRTRQIKLYKSRLIIQ